ncbi:MAG: DEAD/DEAH box helicase family protein [Oligoflexia bacterium]|nr:DEAD/DEAH box helicase family protein [Oligoflexia bacterium]
MSLVKDALRIKVYRYSGQKKVYKETINLYNEKEKSFPTNYLNWLNEKIEATLKSKKSDFKFLIEATDERDEYLAPYLNFKVPEFNPPRPWQKHVIEQCEKHNTGIIIEPTGSGKGYVINYLTLTRRVKTLIIVPTRALRDKIYWELVEVLGKSRVSNEVKKDSEYINLKAKRKAKKAYKSNDRDIYEDVKVRLSDPEEDYLATKGHEVIGNRIYKCRKALDKEEVKKCYADVVVLCFQGLDSLPLDFVQTRELVIIDEGDVASCESIRENLVEFENAIYQYTLTATFWRTHKFENELLIASVGNNILHDGSVVERIEENVILKPKFETILSKPPKIRGKEIYIKEEKGPHNIVKHCIVANTQRNQQLVDKITEHYHEGRRSIVFVQELMHAEILETRFKREGITPFLYYGNLNPKERREIENKASFENGPIVVIATSALQRGIDTINIDTIFLADPRKASRDFFQMIGRGIRIGDNPNLLIYAFYDALNPTTKKWCDTLIRIFHQYYEEEASMSQRIFKRQKIKLQKAK